MTVAAVATACGLPAVLLGGCGAANVIDPVAKAATVSNASPGMRMAFSMRISAQALPAPITGVGSGSFDPAAHTGSVTVAMNFGSIPQVQQALGAGTLRIQEIMSGSNVYVKFPPALARSAVFRGKPWLKINLGAAARSAGLPGLSSLLNNPVSSDPSQFLRYLRAASGHVSEVGTQSVDGFPTTQYRATIQLDRVAQAFPAADRAQVRQTVAELERVTQLQTMPVNVWIDHQHLVRRIRFGLGEQVAGQPLSVAMTIDIPQYGPQSPPQLPPADQVTDVTAGLGTSPGAAAPPSSG